MRFLHTEDVINLQEEESSVSARKRRFESGDKFGDASSPKTKKLHTSSIEAEKKIDFLIEEVAYLPSKIYVIATSKARQPEKVLVEQEDESPLLKELFNFSVHDARCILNNNSNTIAWAEQPSDFRHYQTLKISQSGICRTVHTLPRPKIPGNI